MDWPVCRSMALPAAGEPISDLDHGDPWESLCVPPNP
jgi:hypothetical protein